MERIASRQLRNETRKVLERVEAGDQVIITVGGRDVAVLSALAARPTWVDSHRFLADLEQSRADAALRRELDLLNPDTTDDVPLP